MSNKENKSEVLGKVTGLQVFDSMVKFAKQAGSKGEASYDRDGFLSYHAESHAVGMGAGLGFAIGATGNTRYVGVAMSLVMAGNRGEGVLDGKVAKDIKDEPHYFIGGLVLGVVVAMAFRLVAGIDLPEV